MRSAELFKKSREAKGIKQAEIALKSGLSRPALARFESNSLRLSEEKLAAISEMVDLDPDYFQGVSKSIFKSQTGELIKFFVDKYHAHADFLITAVISAAEQVNIFAISPPLTVIERIRNLNLTGNPLYAMLISDNFDNLFLFRCKSAKDFLSSDISLATSYINKAKMIGKGAYLESQTVTKNLYDKIKEWDNVERADFEYMLNGKDNEIRFKSIILSDAEKILINTLRDHKFNPTELTDMIKCMAEMSYKPEDVRRIIGNLHQNR